MALRYFRFTTKSLIIAYWELWRHLWLPVALSELCSFLDYFCH